MVQCRATVPAIWHRLAPPACHVHRPATPPCDLQLRHHLAPPPGDDKCQRTEPGPSDAVRRAAGRGRRGGLVDARAGAGKCARGTGGLQPEGRATRWCAVAASVLPSGSRRAGGHRLRQPYERLCLSTAPPPLPLPLAAALHAAAVLQLPIRQVSAVGKAAHGLLACQPAPAALSTHLAQHAAPSPTALRRPRSRRLPLPVLAGSTCPFSCSTATSTLTTPSGSDPAVR